MVELLSRPKRAQVGQPITDLPMEFGSRYRLERELGRGAMATVYLAQDILHHREVAIKIIRPNLAPILGPERFVREIRIASQLTHPHILPLLDSGDEDGRLYYVMPVARGDTLRTRLDRERQLSLEDAIRITRDVADALQYADKHGIVHRDIKPENILLEDGRALVADFGIARVVDAAGDARLSSSGIAVGTPDYMSPEQASADRSVDGRSDIYSLGCVMYEMLVGERPFSGASHKVVAMRHMMEKVPSLRLARPDLPPWVEGVVEKALAKTPADRHAGGAELIAAIERGPTLPVPRARRSPWPWIAAAILLLAVGIPSNRWVRHYFENRGVDPERLVVLPFLHLQSAAPGFLNGEICAQLISTSLRRWRDLLRVNELQASDALGRQGEGPPNLTSALRIARSLGAGQLLWGQVYAQGGTIQVTGTLYDVRNSGAVIRDSSVALRGEDDPDVGARFEALADFLVSGGRPIPSPDSRHPLATTRAFAAGMVALNTWDLETARREFRVALEEDPSYGPANLRLASVSEWLGEPPDDWKPFAARAAEPGHGLTGGEEAHAGALLALAEQHYPDACDRYRAIVRRDSTDFAAWFGLGDCQWSDDRVMADARSAGGMRFRSSFEGAGRAYRKALEISPSVHRALQQMLMQRLNAVWPTGPAYYRAGRLAGAPVAGFAAYPGLDHDTMSFVPVPIERLLNTTKDDAPASSRSALERDRLLLDNIASQWTRAFPSSPVAWEARALALEKAGLLQGSGEQFAIPAIRRSRLLAQDSSDRLRKSLLEVRLRLKASDFAGARLLADSVLRIPANLAPGVALDLAPMAGLVGDRERLQHLLEIGAVEQTFQSPDGRRLQASAKLAVPALQLLAYAILGGPPDTVSSLENRIESQLKILPDLRARATLRRALLTAPAELGFPIYGARPLHSDPGGSYLIALQASFAKGEFVALQQSFREIERVRRSPPAVAPGELGLEALYQESWLQVGVGDSTGAIRNLDSALGALDAQNALAFQTLQGPASLVLAMALRARLAAARHETKVARQWAGAVVNLWGGAAGGVPIDMAVIRRIAATGREGP